MYINFAHSLKTIEQVSSKTSASQIEANRVQVFAKAVEQQFSQIQNAVVEISNTCAGNMDMTHNQAASMYEANTKLSNLTQQSQHRKQQVKDLEDNAHALKIISDELRDIMKFFKFT